MPFTLFKGVFKPSAGFPDGDSLRFAPDDPQPLFSLRRRGSRPPRVNERNGTVQLRYEGIDSLEKDAKEPFASDATRSNIHLCGLSGPTDEARGYILANQIGPNGRPICFVFSGEAPEDDHTDIFLDADRLRESVNFKQIQEGSAYPLFYDTLFASLREPMAEATREARVAQIGFWVADKTNVGVNWGGATSLPNLDPIFPKLWRRLEKYTQSRDFRHESATLAAFNDYLLANPDRLFIVSEARSTDLDDILEIDGNRVRLLFLPEDLVFMS